MLNAGPDPKIIYVDLKTVEIFISDVVFLRFLLFKSNLSNFQKYI